MRTNFIIILLFLVTGIYSCKRECNPPTGNRGIIVKSYSDEDFICLHLTQQKFLITTDSVYKAILKINTYRDYCNDVKLPVVDFSQYSLLGQYASGGNEGFLRTATRNDEEKKNYLYGSNK